MFCSEEDCIKPAAKRQVVSRFRRNIVSKTWLHPAGGCSEIAVLCNSQELLGEVTSDPLRLIWSAVVKTATLLQTPGRPKAAVRDVKMNILTAVNAEDTTGKKGVQVIRKIGRLGLLGTGGEEGESTDLRPRKGRGASEQQAGYLDNRRLAENDS